MRKFRSFHSLLTGIAVGVLLGLCISLFNKRIEIYVNFPVEDTSTITFSSDLPPHLMRRGQKSNELMPSNVWVRCVILLESGKQLWPEKNLLSVRGTWARKCNETLYFTDSAQLQHRYGANLSSSMRILLIQQGLSKAENVKLRPRDWALMANLINFLSKLDQKGENNQKVGKKWTVVTDGRSYMHLENLRLLLNQVNDNAAIIVGRKVPIERDFWRSVFSFLFPFSSPTCPPSFGWPLHAGRVIGGCALRLGIALWDPVDEESRPLIVDQNFKFLFSRIAKNATLGKTEDRYSSDPAAVLANCCSDRAIAFALLNHKEQRLIDFGVHHLRVFGR
uniref:Hexosyltransferase n=1 Tax=Globodera rostochiensis TaxID=31243 RepID=A0A914HWB6_GLORO